MAQVINIGTTPIPFSGGYILAGRVKTVPDDEVESLRSKGEIFVLPSKDKSRRPPVSDKAEVAEPLTPEPIPMPPAEDDDKAGDEAEETDEGEESEKSSRRKKSKRRKLKSGG